MPQKIICGSCGEILYDGNDLKAPTDLLEQLKGVCPKCGKKLAFDPTKVDIRALRMEEKNRR